MYEGVLVTLSNANATCTNFCLSCFRIVCSGPDSFQQYQEGCFRFTTSAADRSVQPSAIVVVKDRV